MVSEHHIVLFTSAGARAILEFISIIFIALNGSCCACVTILSLCFAVGLVAFVVYVKFLTTHQQAYEVVFGVASIIMTIFMAVASVKTTVRSSTFPNYFRNDIT